MKYVSLLWPSQISKAYFSIDHKALVDIDLNYVDQMHEDVMTDALKETLKQMPIDGAITRYRQEIMKDFDEARPLYDGFLSVAIHLYELRNMIKFAFERDNTLYNVMKRIEESERILEDLHKLDNLLKTQSVHSKGLIEFRKMLSDLMNSDLFRAYEADLIHVQQKETIRSMKLGLNLDENLSPKEAILLSLEEETFVYTRTIKKIGRVVDRGITELKKIPRRIFAPETTIPQENLNELEKIIEPAMKQLLTFMDTFNNSLLDLFESFKEELLFYRYGLTIKDWLSKEGYPVSQPVFVNPMEDLEIHGLYNMNLAYRMKETGEKMVFNELMIGAEREVVLTGANRGGKTTFTQAIGQCYWLGQLGLYTPSKSASMPVIDGLYVHFPSEEKETVMYGRLGEECQRFYEIYKSMTPESLLLMNESFSGTSHTESLTIAKAAMSSLLKKGSRCLYNTHLHELAIEVHEKGCLMEEDQPYLPGYKNLISGSADSPNSFWIREGEPLGKSYAKEIALRYGVSYDQLIARVKV